MIERARERRQGSGRPTILFLDEIHRFNKAQQDALLPAVEEGLLTLIGATTENPYFEVNSALLSRCQIYELRPLEPGAGGGAAAAGAGRSRARAGRSAAGRGRGAGDARAPLAAATPASRSRRWSGRSSARAGEAVDVAAIEDALQRKALDYDRAGRPPLRLRLGLDQGDARLRRRRLALLPGGDAGGRRGPALHRPPHGHPRLRGRRQRRPAGAARRRRRGARGRPGRPARVRAQPRPGRRLPGAGAEVQRLLQRRSARPAPRSARTAPRRRPTTCATPTTRAPRSSAAARATATRTTSPAASATSRCCRRGLEDRRFYAPTDRGFEAELGRPPGGAAQETSRSA